MNLVKIISDSELDVVPNLISLTYPNHLTLIKYKSHALPTLSLAPVLEPSCW